MNPVLHEKKSCIITIHSNETPSERVWLEISVDPNDLSVLIREGNRISVPDAVLIPDEQAIVLCENESVHCSGSKDVISFFNDINDDFMSVLRVVRSITGVHIHKVYVKAMDIRLHDSNWSSFFRCFSLALVMLIKCDAIRIRTHLRSGLNGEWYVSGVIFDENKYDMLEADPFFK